MRFGSQYTPQTPTEWNKRMPCRDNEWIGPQGDERRAGEGGPLKRVARNDSFMTSMEEELEKQSTKESDRKLEFRTTRNDRHQSRGAKLFRQRRSSLALKLCGRSSLYFKRTAPVSGAPARSSPLRLILTTLRPFNSSDIHFTTHHEQFDQCLSCENSRKRTISVPEWQSGFPR